MEAQESTVRLSEVSDVPSYNVKAVCHRTGITAATLRAWERRYGMPSPNRNSHGYRLYSERDVAILYWLIQQTNAGVSISQAAHQMEQLLNGRQDIVLKIPAHPVRSVQGIAPRSPDAIVDEVSHALMTMDERRADELIAEALALYTLETVLISIMRNALLEVREAHAQRHITTTVEHFAFNFLRQRVLSITQYSPATKAATSIVVIGFGNERNELDLLIMTALLRRNGFSVTYLGAEFQPGLLTNEVSHLQASAVVFYTDDVVNAARLTTVIPPLLSATHPVRMVIAGEALEALPELQSLLGTEYLGSDLRQVLRDLIRGLRRNQYIPVPRP